MEVRIPTGWAAAGAAIPDVCRAHGRPVTRWHGPIRIFSPGMTWPFGVLGLLGAVGFPLVWVPPRHGVRVPRWPLCGRCRRDRVRHRLAAAGCLLVCAALTVVLLAIRREVPILLDFGIALGAYVALTAAGQYLTKSLLRAVSRAQLVGGGSWIAVRAADEAFARRAGELYEDESRRRDPPADADRVRDRAALDDRAVRFGPDRTGWPWDFTVNQLVVVVAAAVFVWFGVRHGFVLAVLVFFCLAVAVLVVVLVFGLVPQELVRRRRLARLVAARGWSHRRRADGVLDRLPAFVSMAGTRLGNPRRQAVDVVAGRFEGWPFVTFHRRFQYSTEEPGAYGSGWTPHSVLDWVVAVEELPVLPPMACRRRRDGDPPGRRTGEPVFDEAFLLTGPAEALDAGLGDTLAALMPRLVESYGADLPWEYAAGVLVVVEHGAAYVDPRRLEPTLRALSQLASALGQR